MGEDTIAREPGPLLIIKYSLVPPPSGLITYLLWTSGSCKPLKKPPSKTIFQRICLLFRAGGVLQISCRIQRKTLCMGPYAEVDYNLDMWTPTHLPWATLCQSRGIRILPQLLTSCTYVIRLASPVHT
jgi:hypothetical protein